MVEETIPASSDLITSDEAYPRAVRLSSSKASNLRMESSAECIWISRVGVAFWPHRDLVPHIGVEVAPEFRPGGYLLHLARLPVVLIDLAMPFFLGHVSLAIGVVTLDAAHRSF